MLSFITNPTLSLSVTTLVYHCLLIHCIFKILLKCLPRAHLFNIRNILSLLRVCRPSDDAHVSGENDLYVGVHEIFVKCRIVRHVKEDRGQFWRPVPCPVAPEAAAIGLDQQSDSLENLVQDFFYRVVALHLLHKLEYELGLLDGGDILVGGRVFDLDLVVKGSSDHFCLHFLLIILLCKLWVVVEELLYSVFVSHDVQVWINSPFGRFTKLLLSGMQLDGRGEPISKGSLLKMWR